MYQLTIYIYDLSSKQKQIASVRLDKLAEVHKFIARYLDRNITGISIRYISGNRFGGSVRQLLDCTKFEYISLFK